MFSLTAWTVYQFFTKINIDFHNCLTDKEHDGMAALLDIQTPRNYPRLIAEDIGEIVKLLRNYLTITRFFGEFDKFPNQLSKVEVVLLLNATKNLHKSMFYYSEPDYKYPPSAELCNQLLYMYTVEHPVYNNVWEW